MNQATRQRITFAINFLVLLVLFYVVIALKPVNDHVIVPFTTAITNISGMTLRTFERDISISGTTIGSPRFSVDVKNGCNAVEAMMLFAAAVLAFPAPLRSRLLALAVGLPIIQIVNMARLTSLFWLGVRHPDWFDIFHIALWQTVIILISVAMFATWSSRVVAPKTASRR